MRAALSIHPRSRCPMVTCIEVEATRPSPGRLMLTYLVTGSIGDLYLPRPSAPARTDALWRRTCFEAFVRAPPREAYAEFNFAPSRAWAAYQFSGCRTGMSVPAGIVAPRMEVQATERSFELRVALDLAGWPMLAEAGAWRLGLSAVIGAADGPKSYWALAHPSGKADFHHADSFAWELPGPER